MEHQEWPLTAEAAHFPLCPQRDPKFPPGPKGAAPKDQKKEQNSNSERTEVAVKKVR